MSNRAASAVCEHKRNDKNVGGETLSWNVNISNRNRQSNMGALIWAERVAYSTVNELREGMF